MKPENCSSCGVQLTTGNAGKILGRCSECSPFLDLFASAMDEPSGSSTSLPSTWVNDACCSTCGEAVQSRWKVCPFCGTTLNASASLNRPRQPVTATTQSGRNELLWTGIGLLVVGFGSMLWTLYEVTRGNYRGFDMDVVGSAIVASIVGAALIGGQSGGKASGIATGLLGGLVAALTALLGAALLVIVVFVSVIMFLVAACASILNGQ
jgi:hypothetical protein